MSKPSGRIPSGRWELFYSRRRTLELTQSEAAARLDVVQSKISEWESMSRPPDWHELPKVAAFLGTTPEELAANIAKNFCVVVS